MYTTTKTMNIMMVPSGSVKEIDKICVDNIPRVGNVNEVSKGVWNNDGFGIYETSKQTVDLTQIIGAIGP